MKNDSRHRSRHRPQKALFSEQRLAALNAIDNGVKPGTVCKQFGLQPEVLLINRECMQMQIRADRRVVRDGGDIAVHMYGTQSCMAMLAILQDFLANSEA